MSNLNLQRAIDLLVKGQSYETPFDAQVIEEVAKYSATVGFMGAGDFKEAARDNPISTLLKLIKFEQEQAVVTPPAETSAGSGPLDAAVYVPAVGPREAFIAGVRGGTVYNLSASDGSLVSQARFTPVGFGPSCIEYEPNNDQLLTASHLDPYTPNPSVTPGFPQPQQEMLMYQVTPGSLAAASSIDVGNSFGSSGVPTYIKWGLGVIGIKYNPVTSFVYLSTVIDANNSGVDFLSFDPTNLAAYADWGFLSNGSMWGDFDFDNSAGRDAVWAIDQESCMIWGLSMTPDGFGSADGGWVELTFRPSSVWMGIAVKGTAMYASHLTRYIDVYNLAAAVFGNHFTMTPPTLTETLDTGDENFIGLHARYNSYDGKVYVSGYSSNKVAVIDTNAGNALTILTGFDLPLDFVFTPTKVFCVQHGAIGLKQIV